ncbi:MAG: Hpt domain-containing protein [Blastomonas sp.]
MAYETGSLDVALNAVVGDDQALMAELRQAFISSAERQIDLLQRSRCDANWHFAALRLKGLAASFGVGQVIELADQALEGAPGDPVVLRSLQQAVSGLNRLN